MPEAPGARRSAASHGNSPQSRRVTRWLALVANVGALIGLLLVGVQLRQNRDLMRAQVRHELAMGIVELLNSPAGNRRGDVDFGGLRGLLV